MIAEPADPLLLGQRIVAILETGQRDATYKLATLMTLIEHCIENLPDHPADSLRVPIPELAHRVLAIYWRQVRPFEGRELVQRRTGKNTRITDATKELREVVRTGHSALSFEVAMLRAPEAYRRAIDKIVLALAKQPLPRLQKLPGSANSDPFLYDDSFLGENVSRRTLRENGDTIVLSPGVAHGLARLAGLLRPALEIMWVEDVRRMNKFLDTEVPDVAGHLFGRERTALAAVRGPFKDVFGPYCFYCGRDLPDNNPIDHVLPWSLVGIDGLSNLVLACARCNGDKGGALPSLGIVDRVLSRDRDALEEIAAAIQWPSQHERVAAAARGIYLGQPKGVPTWTGYKSTVRLDIAFAPTWIRAVDSADYSS
ncbi:HNH endonuclease [Mycolicibacterium flavescens]|uniref:HNH endonuclease n=1 Tax=Mycolicibacterium flavescens TaxID=1776 RepID=A0A1E3RM07_MYCFV|nr:HNH endonuclease [Mycolicibacterium flavescens]MCV7281698.1 HNH endonuclease [Mycolicibacterium flavescens]ODQ90899.1 HNH endonuclease [Mycolicibacterium flavescens]